MRASGGESARDACGLLDTRARRASRSRAGATPGERGLRGSRPRDHLGLCHSSLSGAAGVDPVRPAGRVLASRRSVGGALVRCVSPSPHPGGHGGFSGSSAAVLSRPWGRGGSERALWFQTAAGREAGCGDAERSVPGASPPGDTHRRGRQRLRPRSRGTVRVSRWQYRAARGGGRGPRPRRAVH